MWYRYFFLTLLFVACATDTTNRFIPAPPPVIPTNQSSNEEDYVILTPAELDPPTVEKDNSDPPKWNGDFLLDRSARTIALLMGQIHVEIRPDKHSDGRLDFYPIPTPWNDRFTQIEVMLDSISATAAAPDFGIDCIRVVKAQKTAEDDHYRLLPMRVLHEYGADCGRLPSMAIVP